jgi:hypothetical protein
VVPRSLGKAADQWVFGGILNKARNVDWLLGSASVASVARFLVPGKVNEIETTVGSALDFLEQNKEICFAYQPVGQVLFYANRTEFSSLVLSDGLKIPMSSVRESQREGPLNLHTAAVYDVESARLLQCFPGDLTTTVSDHGTNKYIQCSIAIENMYDIARAAKETGRIKQIKREDDPFEDGNDDAVWVDPNTDTLMGVEDVEWCISPMIAEWNNLASIDLTGSNAHGITMTHIL